MPDYRECILCGCSDLEHNADGCNNGNIDHPNTTCPGFMSRWDFENFTKGLALLVKFGQENR